jgi:hypothetical protein
MNKIYILCKKVQFYSSFDEDAFFEWIKKIDCIDNYEGADNELYLDIACLDLHDHDLRDLISLLYRYNIDMKQLKMFLNDKNTEWFTNPKAYWHKRVFKMV